MEEYNVELVEFKLKLWNNLLNSTIDFIKRADIDNEQIKTSIYMLIESSKLYNNIIEKNC